MKKDSAVKTRLSLKPLRRLKAAFRAGRRRLFESIIWWIEELRRPFLQVLFIGMIGLFLLIEHMVVPIEPGHAGVLWKRFAGGTVLTSTLSEGTNVIWPWDRVILYDIRSRVDKRIYHPLSKDGLEVEIEVAYRYKPNLAALGFLHKTVGEEFPVVLVEPNINAATHTVIANYTSDALYSAERENLQEEISQRVKKEMNVQVGGKSLPLVTVQEFLLSHLSLPDRVKKAIESKEAQRQKAEELTFRILRQQKEVTRMAYEAAGIRRFMDEVAPGIDPSYLRYNGLKATNELANSRNTKVLILGPRGRKTPLIIDTSGTSPASFEAEETSSATMPPPSAMMSPPIDGNKDAPP
ncbi:MAG: prohibitin family protein [Alphaproteobacteria bacterium]|nr:prohibitin family protein [Alphaproteobacteria bacterium]